MYKPKQMQCLSFGHSKPLQIGHGGAILLDNKEAYETLLRMRYDGRDLTFSPWEEQKTFAVGYHYRPTIEDAGVGITLLNEYKTNNNTSPIYIQYPDCRTINITD
jgi:dTDP-4-amino-4,6-dideoxygalactose transaminase